MAGIWQAIHEHVAHDCHRMLRRILAGGAEAAAKARTEKELKLAALGPWFFDGDQAVLYRDPAGRESDWKTRVSELRALGVPFVERKDGLYVEGDDAAFVQNAHEAVLCRLLARIPQALCRDGEDDLIMPVDGFSGPEFEALLGGVETELAGLAGSAKAYHTARAGNVEAVFCMGFGNVHLEGRAARMMKASLRAHAMPLNPWQIPAGS